MSPPPDDHACAWKGEAERLRADLERLRGEFDALKRQAFGTKRERVEPLKRAVRKKRPPDPERAKQVRAERALAKQRLESTGVEHPVPDEQKRCLACKGMADRPLDDQVSVEYEYVPERFRKRIHRRKTLACACGEHVVTAPAPARVAEKTTYGPGFVAHVVVSKCADAIPLYRMEKHYGRLGIPIARSTLCDLFHRAARELAPLAALVGAALCAVGSPSPPWHALARGIVLGTVAAGVMTALKYVGDHVGTALDRADEPPPGLRILVRN